jgi:hypothetical protein
MGRVDIIALVVIYPRRVDAGQTRDVHAPVWTGQRALADALAVVGPQWRRLLQQGAAK